jgi:HPt (histidine-containing phosphotransfer) domain-containing protein
VDDNQTNRRILYEMLLNWGMRPTLAESGKSALVAFDAVKGSPTAFPLILIDAHMPEMDGFALAERTVKMAEIESCVAGNLPAGEALSVVAKRSAPFGEAAFLARMGGEQDLCAQIAEAFFTEGPQLMAPIREALRRKDAMEVARLAHGLKGAISNFSSGAAFHAAVRLEQFAKEGDTTLAFDAFKQLERDMNDLTNALQDFVRAVPRG